MKGPNFLIVGAPKSGTTALHSYLAEHENVFVPRVKEPHFFAPDFRASNYVRSEETYGALFEPAGEGHTAIGEASVCYLYSTVAATLVRKALPDVKIIAMLRDPIEMFVSLHNQTRASMFEDEADPERAWNLQSARRRGELVPRLCEEPRFLFYKDFCSVGTQLERWTSLFSSDQMHTILFDELKADPLSVYREVLDFLELPDDGRREFPLVNQARRARLLGLQKLHTQIDRRFRRSPRLRRQRWLLQGLRPLSQAFLKRNVKTVEKPILRPEFRARLVEEFAADVALLDELLGRGLPWADTYDS